MTKKEKKKKKGYGKVFGFCVVVGCITALLWGAGNFGIGDGLLPWGQVNSGNGNGNGGYTGQNDQPQETPPPIEINEAPGVPVNGEESEPELLIRVVRGLIYHGERQITIDELVPLLEELSRPGYVWELHDEQAIVETYENVKAIMRENGIEFIER